MSSDVKWPCPSCTFLNNTTVSSCIMCETAQPAMIARTVREIETTSAAVDTEPKDAEMTDPADEPPLESKLDEDGDWEVKDDPNAAWEDGEDDADWDELGGDDEEWGAIVHPHEAMQDDIEVATRVQKFFVLNPRDLQKEQVDFLLEMKEFLALEDTDECAAICRFFGWNRSVVTDSWVNDGEEKVRLETGLDSAEPSVPDDSDPFFCMICCNDVPLARTYHLGCGHQLCFECWTNYCSAEMDKGPRVIYTRCFQPGCGKLVDIHVFENFFADQPESFTRKYHEYLTHSFVMGRRDIEWCPGPNCTRACRAEFGTTDAIRCDCGYTWCFICKEQNHLPCDCHLAERWTSLCYSDSENVMYIRANTKQCPKCKSQIEKNEGCNHMTCRCGFEFCWLCKKDWKQTGYGHTCNKPKDVQDVEQNAGKAQIHLKRFQFYFSRFETHGNSAKFASDSFANANAMIGRFMETDNSLKYADLAYIKDAITVIIHCRRLLQWSYCYGYYMKDDTNEKLLFENQQGLLETFSDQLHEKAEKSVEGPDVNTQLLDIRFREQLINLTKTVARYRVNLSEAIQDSTFVEHEFIIPTMYRSDSTGEIVTAPET